MRKVILGTVYLLFFSALAPTANASRINTYTFQTADNFTIALTRKSPDYLDPRKAPIMLVHGLAMNHYCWDIQTGLSFADALVSAGYDAWMLDLRGAGGSTHPTTNADWNWSIETYLRYDFNEAIPFILDQTNSSQLFLMGHSMGGMLQYEYLITHPNNHVKGALAFSSSASFEYGSQGLQLIDSLLGQYITDLPYIPVQIVLQLVQPLSSTLNSPLGGVFYDYQNMSTNILSQTFGKAMENITDGVLQDFLYWAEKGDESNHNHTFDYTEYLGYITTPYCFFSGGGDLMCPMADVQVGYYGIHSKDKTQYKCGIFDGYAANYGHLDMLIGEAAPKEIYPRAIAWLNAHSGDDNINVLVTQPKGVVTTGMGRIGLSGTATSTASQIITSVEVSFNHGATSLPATGLGSWSYVWQTPGPGNYTVWAKAEDLVGTTSGWQQGPSFVVVAVPPRVDIIQPLSGDILPLAPVTVTGTADDANASLNLVELSVDNGQSYDPVRGSSAWQTTWNPSAAGLYTLKAEASDFFGNTAYSPENPVITIAGRAPALTFPPPSPFYAGVSAMLSGTAQGISGTHITQVQVSTDGGRTFSDANGTATWFLRFTPPTTGVYTFVAKAVDNLNDKGILSILATAGTVPPTPTPTATPTLPPTQTSAPTTTGTPATTGTMTPVTTETPTPNGTTTPTSTQKSIPSYTVTPSPAQTPMPPALLLGGWWSTRLTHGEGGGQVTVMAAVSDVERATVVVTYGGKSLGISLDPFGPSGSVQEFTYNTVLSLPNEPGKDLVGLMATVGTESSTWPWLVVGK